MIDLHIHTNYSDGTDTLISVLKKAEEKKLEYISITDHNTCKAYNELANINVKDYYSGNIITGVELNTKILGVPIEVLGYGIDIKKIEPVLTKTYLSPFERNKLEVKRLYDKCLESGIKLSTDFVTNYNPAIYASKYLHSELIKNEYNKQFIDNESWDNSINLYRKYMSDPNSLLYVDTNDILPDFETVRKIIKDAGGMIFIPHIFEYKDNSLKILNYILDNYEIDGLECYYTTFSKEQTNYLLDICKLKNLYVSGGSDYHGNYKPDVDIGIGKGNLKIPYNILTNYKL